MSSSIQNFHYLLKYIIVGDSFVGKSNILLQFTQQRFNSSHELTIGVEFGAKNVVLDEDKIYRIQIWDTAGQETFKSITRAYYKNSVCAFLVYDITRRSSFLNIGTWLEECKAQSPKTIFLVLIGNKIDLDDKEVSTEEGKIFAQKNKMLFFEVSAKTGFNINETFSQSAIEIAKNIQKGMYDLTSDNSGIKQGIGNTQTMKNSLMLNEAGRNSEKKKKSKCC